VQKLGKKVDDYYVTKAIQLYLEGVSYREIERILGISHVSVMNWVRQNNIKRPENRNYHPTYKILTHEELLKFQADRENMKGAGMIITELGDKYMMIKWERFRD
jgi:transposase